MTQNELIADAVSVGLLVGVQPIIEENLLRFGGSRVSFFTDDSGHVRVWNGRGYVQSQREALLVLDKAADDAVR